MWGPPTPPPAFVAILMTATDWEEEEHHCYLVYISLITNAFELWFSCLLAST